MIIFRYDQSWEGLLTALFDAFARRQWPDLFLAPGEPPPLFTEEDHTVVTNPAKATRVWNGLGKRVPAGVRNMLALAFLSEESGVDMRIMNVTSKIFTQPGSHTDFADFNLLRIKQLALKVSHERTHLWQFTRFQKGADGQTWYAPVSPIYNVLPIAIPWFADRFRDQLWLVYDIRRDFGFYYDMKETIEVIMPDGPPREMHLADDEHLFQEAWRDYLRSITIASRINPRLQRQHMPARFWPLMTEQQ